MPGDDQGAPQPEAEPLEAAGEDRPGQQRADQAERGRVRRGGALRQQQRPQAGAEECPEREPAEGQHAYDESLPEADQGQQGPANATIIQSSCVTCHVLQAL